MIPAEWATPPPRLSPDDGLAPAASPALASAPHLALNGSEVPFRHLTLAVGDGHELHIEEVGAPSGLPVVFLHGGPGSGCRPAHRRLFDPTRFRSVLFDQRGAGRSRPHGSRVANTTPHLIADLEAIRRELAIERWLVVGGSWGATLGLAYAQRFPQHVAGLVLRAVFLGTRAELDWAFVEGPRRIRPDLYRAFLEVLPPAERADPLPAYWRRILDPDPAIHRPAAWRWHDTERILSEIAPGSPVPGPAERPDGSLPATPFMEAHYFRNECFLKPGELLTEAGRLAGIPGIIVQGRYDLLCPPASAFALAEAWPEARLVFVEGAGHAMTEPGVTEATTAAVEALARRIETESAAA